MTDRPNLETIFGRRGWLSENPVGFRAQLLGLGVKIEARSGATVFREGDSSNGLFGIITGSIGVEGGHRRQSPLLGHVMRAGDWFGIKALFNGGMRDLTYRALEPTQLLCLPSARLVPLINGDPEIAVRVGQLAELGNRLGAWATRDLLTPDAGRRLAAVMVRVLAGGEIAPDDPRGFTLSHQQLGEMANVSRHHVGRKLAVFEKQGWILCGYNRIQLRDLAALANYAYGSDDR